MTSREAALAIIERLRASGHTALLAGGCVRDYLLGIEPSDHDVATDAAPEQVCALFRRTKQVGAQFGVVLVRISRQEIEVATFRTDGDYRDGRRPEAVRFATAEEDARRRDFTVNGMFLDPETDTVVDYVGGRADLEARLIRCIGDADARFAEDHLRMLRAVRFAARLGFAIETTTQASIQRHAARIAGISAERVRMELEMILGHASRAEGWRLLGTTGLRPHLIRGITWTDEEAEYCSRVLAALRGQVSDALGFAAIFCRLDGESIQAACRKLRCSVATSRATEGIVDAANNAVHGRIAELADIKTLLASGLWDDVLALARGHVCAGGRDGSGVETLARRGAAIAPQDYAPPPLVTGEDLQALKLPPGPRYRTILDALYRAQLNEELIERAAALQRARQLVERGD